MDTPMLVIWSVALMILPVFLVVIVAYFNIQAERMRAAEEATRAPEAAAARAEHLVSAEPRFFAKPGSAVPRRRIGRAVVVQIEDYLARERAAVDYFVTSPSPETLCRGSETFAMRQAAAK
jgi:hypothetical protein